MNRSKGSPLMPEITALFIDDGGVLNDNALRGPAWQRLVADFFAPILGGDPTTWAEANRVVFERLWQFIIAGPQGQEYTVWYDTYQLRWLREMAAFARVAAPVDDAECLRLAWQAGDYITRRVRAAYPGAANAIHALRGTGRHLFTASGGLSRQLDGYLTGMGIREHFSTLYGPDLVNQAKDGIQYYRCIFAHAGVDPKHTLVVDDSLHVLAWARGAGAMTCLVSATSHQDPKADLTVTTLSDLPAALARVLA